MGKAIGVLHGGQPWTAEDDNQLRQMAQQGHSLRQIADVMRRTYEAVRARAKRLSPTDRSSMASKVKPSSPEHEALLRELYAEGVDFVELAEQVGRSVSSIRAHAHALGVHRKRPKSGPKPRRPTI
jgi:hypothetical protein